MAGLQFRPSEEGHSESLIEYLCLKVSKEGKLSPSREKDCPCVCILEDHRGSSGFVQTDVGHRKCCHLIMMMS